LLDLNPVAAGLAAVRKASEHASIKQRVEHVAAEGRPDDVNRPEKGTPYFSA
jgi:hypothetical protein